MTSARAQTVTPGEGSQTPAGWASPSIKWTALDSGLHTATGPGGTTGTAYPYSSAKVGWHAGDANDETIAQGDSPTLDQAKASAEAAMLQGFGHLEDPDDEDEVRAVAAQLVDARTRPMSPETHEIWLHQMDRVEAALTRLGRQTRAL